MPPQDAILVPPFLSPPQIAKLVSRRSWSTGEPDDGNSSSLESETGSGGEPVKLKKLVKRRAKATRRPAESSDEEEETAQQRLRRRRRVNHVPDLTTSHSEDEVASVGEIIISSD